jgi:hypothetical protein
MAQPIYKIFMGRFLEAWYQLSKEEQNNLIAKLNEALEKVGGKRPLLCNSNWSSDQWNLLRASSSNSCLVRSLTSSSRKYASMSDLIRAASWSETSLSPAAEDTEVSAISRASSRLRRSTSAPRNQLPLLRKDALVWLSSRRSLYGISCLSKTGLAAFSVKTGPDQTIATIVPPRFGHASLIALCCSKSIKRGLARLPQPIAGAAPHTKGTSQKVTISMLAELFMTGLEQVSRKRPSYSAPQLVRFSSCMGGHFTEP